MENKDSHVVKYYKIIIPGRYMGLLIPASQLDSEKLRFIYELSGGIFEIHELVMGPHGLEEVGREEGQAKNHHRQAQAA